MHAVLEAFIDLSKRGDLAPAQVMWVKGTPEDGPGDVASNHAGFVLLVPGTKFGGRGLSKSEAARTSGSWSAPYTGKNPTVQHLTDD